MLRISERPELVDWSENYRKFSGIKKNDRNRRLGQQGLPGYLKLSHVCH